MAKKKRNVQRDEEKLARTKKRGEFFWNLFATSWSLSACSLPRSATASSSRFSKRWFSHYVNGKMCRISWPCEMEFLLFIFVSFLLRWSREPVPQVEGALRLSLCATASSLLRRFASFVCCITRVLSCLVVITVLAKLSRLRLQAWGFCCLIVGLLSAC